MKEDNLNIIKAYTLSARVITMIEELVENSGKSASAIVRLAVEELYNRETEKAQA